MSFASSVRTLLLLGAVSLAANAEVCGTNPQDCAEIPSDAAKPEESTDASMVLSFKQMANLPEQGSLALIGASLIGLGLIRRRR